MNDQVVRKIQSENAPYAGLAKVYDTLLGDRFHSRLRHNFERLWQRYGLHMQSAADVACGTGTFVRYLSRLGLRRLYGVDRSSEMLRIAMAKNRGSRIPFLRQDFNHLQLPELVDLITCNFDSLNYVLSERDLLQVMRRFHANLAGGGMLIFDMITRQQPWRGNRPLLEHRSWSGGEFRRCIGLDPHTGLQTSLVRIRLGNRIYREQHRQRAYPMRVIEPLLRRAGFSLLEARDFYTWQPINRQTRRVAVVAQKLPFIEAI